MDKHAEQVVWEAKGGGRLGLLFRYTQRAEKSTRRAMKGRVDVEDAMLSEGAR